MTIAPERVAETGKAAKDPRDLVSPETFGSLVEDIMRYHPVTRTYAERVMEQGLIFLAAHGKSLRDSGGDPDKWIRIAPSRSVDVAWHAFILRSKAYAVFCEELAGRYMHHLPVMDDDIRSGAALDRTITAMQATGYPVDMEFWRDGASCCPENCGTVGKIIA